MWYIIYHIDVIYIHLCDIMYVTHLCGITWMWSSICHIRGCEAQFITYLTQHVTNLNLSCHRTINGCLSWMWSQMNTSLNHATYEWVMAQHNQRLFELDVKSNEHVTESCHIWMSHGTGQSTAVWVGCEVKSTDSSALLNALESLWVAVCCSVLQCVAVCCSVLQTPLLFKMLSNRCELYNCVQSTHPYSLRDSSTWWTWLILVMIPLFRRSHHYIYHTYSCDDSSL